MSDQGNLIFILWGNHAKEKRKFIDTKEKNNYILTASHPSPLSCNKGGFFGCNNFNYCNEILKQLGKKEINWNSINSR